MNSCIISRKRKNLIIFKLIPCFFLSFFLSFNCHLDGIKFISHLNSFTILKKIKFYFAGLALLLISSLPSLGQSEEPVGPIDYSQWICCQSVSTGCWDMNGTFWPTDYKLYNHPTCP